ncbi:hypothetical protein N473_04560 [Pseudoalteromonas luteoviolacea CPMOR-1]|uniref:HTH cro/C1-type domain-containing protein n=1 Tax=Pseudoalteromonas luteoviolacea CPMOR-1 TaxID=1365248 RepID=A0A167HZL8_9GAMM|nr:hypothetical protein [Pseudoalteromonas luteoviolacea]KZN58711.1 hypothetical protein N473_04560 [Pseudoalteromonas luteoviolacea CPMOR-1]
MNFNTVIDKAIKSFWLEISIVTKSMRLDSGLNQCELGKKLTPSLSKSTISAREEGKKPIPAHQFLMFCFICGFAFEKINKQELENQHQYPDKK